EKNGRVDWVSGSFGSKISMLYPMSILKGDNSSTEYMGISFAGEGQNLDTGFKVLHIGKNTTSNVLSKSISKSGGIATYRSVVNILKSATGAKCSVSCDGLMLDSISRSDTIPVNKIANDTTIFSHEAKVGKISEEAIYYLTTRGLTEQDAKAMIVRGFANPISKALPMEYAVEMNRLIDLELEEVAK
ncbi:MAG TPA: Fe-S cluster assembly protein SufB, partial [Clostridiales bacterium]|nr:Fe-S cluster assembly protein SufB [Clostridiales bacterium]